MRREADCMAAAVSYTHLGILAPAGFDIEIVEKHHNLKVDAPSGTALALADSINEELGNQYELSLIHIYLLFEVKFYFVSKHLPDDPAKFAGTVSKGIVVRPVFRSLGIIISLESGVVFYIIVSCIHEGIA